MKTLIGFVSLSAALMAVASGCSFAGMEARPGTYHINGYTANPEMAASIMSENYVNETNAREYWRAVREGRAYAYPGGLSSDYAYFFGGIIPEGYARPAPVPAATAAPSGDAASRQDLEAVRQQAAAANEKSDDAIRILKRIRKGGAAQ